MDISVLISVYNKENPEYLKESLESIVNQTYLPHQIVIIKDGQLTDELEIVLNEYKDKYKHIIEIYSLNKKRGLGEALKFGVQKCKCRYIARQDTDDIALLDRFEKQIKVLDKDDSIDVLGGYIEEYDESMTKLISIRKVPLENENIKETIKIQCPFNHGTVIMKKDAVLKAGNYDNIPLEDYDLWARMLIQGCKTKNIAEILGKNRTGKSMYKRRSGIKQIKKVLILEKRLLNYKIINKSEYVYNIVIRSIVALFPISLKSFIYKYIIRKI